MDIDVHGRRVELEVDVAVWMTPPGNKRVVSFGEGLAKGLRLNEPLVDSDQLNRAIAAMMTGSGDHAFHHNLSDLLFQGIKLFSSSFQKEAKRLARVH